MVEKVAVASASVIEKRGTSRRRTSAVRSAKSEKSATASKAQKSSKASSSTASASKKTTSRKSATSTSRKTTQAKASSKSSGESKEITSHNKSLGKRGEDAAARFLANHGYTILSRNYTCQFGEADIIAKTPDTLVFVEVKTRTDEDKGMPEEAVTPKKRDKYEKIAISYLREYEDVDIAVRFDVIGILVIAPDRAVIRHHINAFGVGC